MSERGAVRFGESLIEYEVQRSQRRKKTVEITVDGGGVQVARTGCHARGRIAADRAEAGRVDHSP